MAGRGGSVDGRCPRSRTFRERFQSQLDRFDNLLPFGKGRDSYGIFVFDRELLSLQGFVLAAFKSRVFQCLEACLV